MLLLFSCYFSVVSTVSGSSVKEIFLHSHIHTFMVNELKNYNGWMDVSINASHTLNALSCMNDSGWNFRLTLCSTKYPPAKYTPNMYVHSMYLDSVAFFPLSQMKSQMKHFPFSFIPFLFEHFITMHRQIIIFPFLNFWTNTTSYSMNSEQTNSDIPKFTSQTVHISRHVCVNWIERIQICIFKVFFWQFSSLFFFISPYYLLFSIYLLEVLIVHCCFIFCWKCQNKDDMIVSIHWKVLMSANIQHSTLIIVHMHVISNSHWQTRQNWAKNAKLKHIVHDIMLFFVHSIRPLFQSIMELGNPYRKTKTSSIFHVF